MSVIKQWDRNSTERKITDAGKIPPVQEVSPIRDGRHSTKVESNSTGSSWSSGNVTRSLYSRYKEATQLFQDLLAALLTEYVPLVSVSDLGNGVEYLPDCYVESKKTCVTDSTLSTEFSQASPPVIGKNLLSFLSTSINLREECTAMLWNWCWSCIHARYVALLPKST